MTDKVDEVFVAPKDHFRITYESMEDGMVEIVGDFPSIVWAVKVYALLLSEEKIRDSDGVFLVLNDAGKPMPLS